MFRHYVNVYRAFFNQSLAAQIEYKGNFIIDMIVEFSWTLVTVFSIEMMFYHTSAIAGWSKGEVMFLYALYRLGTGFSNIVIHRNIYRFSRLINSGEFDILLTKPVSVLFHAFTRLVAIDRASQFISALSLLAYSFSLLENAIQPQQLAVLIIVIPIAALIRLCFEIILVTPVFWLQKLENISDLQIILFNPARFPRGAFPLWFNRIFTFLIPVLMVGALPAEIVLQKSSPVLIVSMIAVAGILFVSMRAYFNFALKSYTSASS